MIDEDCGELLTLSNAAASAMNTILREDGFDPKSAGVRISVERGGCAGLSYRFDLVSDPGDGDLVHETAQANVVIDRPSAQYVRGAEVGLDRTAHGTGFTIENPNAEQECGCGLSFQ
jgi:iron-sulfur cluster assembly accessory protein